MDRDLSGAVVFRVVHIRLPRELDDGDTGFYIGIYSTRERAEAAVEQLLDQPGFVEHPQGFCIDEVTVDRTSWADGYLALPNERWSRNGS